jgi:hypothetical protein
MTEDDKNTVSGADGQEQMNAGVIRKRGGQDTIKTMPEDIRQRILSSYNAGRPTSQIAREMQGMTYIVPRKGRPDSRVYITKYRIDLVVAGGPPKPVFKYKILSEDKRKYRIDLKPDEVLLCPKCPTLCRTIRHLVGHFKCYHVEFKLEDLKDQIKIVPEEESKKKIDEPIIPNYNILPISDNKDRRIYKLDQKPEDLLLCPKCPTLCATIHQLAGHFTQKHVGFKLEDFKDQIKIVPKKDIEPKSETKPLEAQKMAEDVKDDNAVAREKKDEGDAKKWHDWKFKRDVGILYSILDHIEKRSTEEQALFIGIIMEAPFMKKYISSSRAG